MGRFGIGTIMGPDLGSGVDSLSRRDLWLAERSFAGAIVFLMEMIRALS